jgi:hypothetical protein
MKLHGLPLAAGLVALGVLLVNVPAKASTLTFDLTKSFQSGNTCTGCGPFGTVTVSSVTADEVQITLTPAPGGVYAFGGAGHSMLFDLSGNPTITDFQVVTAPTNSTAGDFSFSQAPPVIMADGTGSWNDAVTCGSCTGTSMNIHGTLTVDLTAATAIAPSSFMKNANGLYFGSDLGVPNGSGGLFTGDVAATSVAPVPLPAAAWLMLSGLGGLGAMARKRKAV